MVVDGLSLHFQCITHTDWHPVTYDGTGALTLTDIGASFPIATGGGLTLFIAAPPNGGSVWVAGLGPGIRCAVRAEITADLPAATQLLSPRLFMNKGATATVIVYDCSGGYVETDF